MSNCSVMVRLLLLVTCEHIPYSWRVFATILMVVSERGGSHWYKHYFFQHSRPSTTPLTTPGQQLCLKCQSQCWRWCIGDVDWTSSITKGSSKATILLLHSSVVHSLEVITASTYTMTCVIHCNIWFKLSRRLVISIVGRNFSMYWYLFILIHIISDVYEIIIPSRNR